MRHKKVLFTSFVSQPALWMVVEYKMVLYISRQPTREQHCLRCVVPCLHEGSYEGVKTTELVALRECALFSGEERPATPKPKKNNNIYIYIYGDRTWRCAVCAALLLLCWLCELGCGLQRPRLGPSAPSRGTSEATACEKRAGGGVCHKQGYIITNSTAAAVRTYDEFVALPISTAAAKSR